MPYITESKLDAFKSALSFISSIKASTMSGQAENNRRKAHGVYSPGLTKSSIMKAGKDLVMSFPVICSDTLQPETAAMITKAIERNCVTQLQMVFSASYLKGANGYDILNQWHKNLDDSIGLDDYISLIDSISYTIDDNGTVNTNKYYTKASGSKLSQNLDKFLKPVGEMTQLKEAMCKAVKENNHYFPENSFADHGIICFELRETYTGYDVILSTINEADFNPNDYVADSRTGMYIPKAQADYNARKDEEANRQQERATRNAADQRHRNQEREEFEYRKDKDKTDEIYRQDRDRILDNRETERIRSLALKDESEFFTRQLMDNDVRKCNELVPSMIIIRYNVVDKDVVGTPAIEQQFIAGVKARLIPCSSEEIIDRLRVVLLNKVSRINWVRATTGEISFMKDFVMGIEQAKIDAKRNSALSKTSPLWRSLQFRSSKSTLNRLKKNKANDAGAITTLVLNATEVNAMKKSYNIDLYNLATAQEVMENYNFMGLVIVDEDMEVARFLFDGEKYFQDISFAQLERETGDGSYKKVVNLISKINRG